MSNTDDMAAKDNLVSASMIFLSDEPGDAVVTEVYKEQFGTISEAVVEVTTTVVTDCKTGDEIVRNNYI